MKSSWTRLNRIGRLLLYGSWFWALTGLLAGRRYEAFLRPEFGALLALGVLFVLAFGLAEAERPGGPAHFDPGAAFRGAVLLAPLLCLPLTRGASLTAEDFDQRWTGPRAEAGPAPALMPSPDADPPGAARRVTLLELARDARHLDGRRVAVEGVVRRDPEVAAQFGPDTAILYRFAITCCIADARPVAVLLVGELPPTLTEDAWVRVVGRIRMEHLGGVAMACLHLEEVAPTPSPRNPYLH